MSRNQLRSGVILSYLNLGISFVIPFVYTPLMLNMLGQAEYGLYGIANSIMGCAVTCYHINPRLRTIVRMALIALFGLE